MSLTLENVLDDSALLFLENRAAFADWIHQQTGGGSDRQKVDLARRQVTYLPKLVKREEVVITAHLVAMIGGDPATTRWAWAVSEVAEQPVAQLSQRLREFGEANQISTFTDPSPSSSRDVMAEATAVAAAACRVTGMPVAHLMEAGDHVVVLILDPANFLAPPPSAAGLDGVLDEARASTLVNDWRRAVQGWAQARGLPYRWADGFGSIDLRLPDGEVAVRFDERGMPSLDRPPAPN